MRDVISVENLSKEYRLGEISSGTFYGDIERWWAKLWGLPDPYLQIGTNKNGNRVGEAIWALRDVSFTVEQGETLGVIGRNGAGKSTLLKIFSQVTAPTSGYVKVIGRIASLLEVGTGFHPELTGRENVFLNGAILGMKRDEVSRKFDEIVDFSGVEKFIDTPVKRYSSGMYVRLAFAVAAYLEPEILLVDEVLAVGDAEFQKKCLGKMGNAAQQGRTVLFVSHSMNAIETLCKKALLLSSGQIQSYGHSNEVIQQYLQSSGSQDAVEMQSDDFEAIQNPFVDISSFNLVDRNQNTSSEFSASEAVGVLIEGNLLTPHSALTIGFSISTIDGKLLFWSYHTDADEFDWLQLQKGNFKMVGWIPPHFLNEGEYVVQLMISLHFQEWVSEPGNNAPGISFTIRGGLSNSPYWISARPGLLAPIIKYQQLHSSNSK